MKHNNHYPLWLFVFFPAVAMLLGWGLRGYIGGGPFGALIPGCYVALCLVLLLNYRSDAAATVALFGAVGVAYGGDMTYGQTLGFLKQPDTVYWGLIGCLVKGSVWGLLGGAVLGVGLTRANYERKTIVIAFLITIVACYVGIKLINEPKLIYFSNRLDKPRDESWAGLLFAAIAFLTYLRGRGKNAELRIPLRFALWGALGGGVGFAGGALWMVFGPMLKMEHEYIGWWKAMEFSFGFCFGAALGYAAYLNRDALALAGQQPDPAPVTWRPLVIFFAFAATIFVAYPMLARMLPDGLESNTSFAAMIVRDILRVTTGFILFGAVAIILGLRSRCVAWQVAITLTFFHTVLDLVRDMDTPEKFGYALPQWVQLAIIVCSTVVMGYIVQRIQMTSEPVLNLLLLAVWSCYATATARSFFRTELFFPPEGQSVMTVLVEKHTSIFFVHGTFTVSALLTTWWALRYFRTGQKSA